MNYFKRCILNIIRKPSKTLLLFLIVFLLGNLVCGSYAITQSTTKVKDNIKQQLGGLITIHAKSKMNDDIYNHYACTSKPYMKEKEVVDIFNEVSNHELVHYKDYMYSYLFESRDIIFSRDFEYSEVKKFDPLINLPVFGVSQSYFSDIKNERIVITEGRTFTDEEIETGSPKIILHENYQGENNTCDFISYEYIYTYGEKYYICNREKRKLNVGDKIELVRQIYDSDINTWTGFPYDRTVHYEDKKEYEIIGFYKNLEEYRDNSFHPSTMELNGNQVTTYQSYMLDGAYIPANNLIHEIYEFQEYVDQYKDESIIGNYGNDINLNSLTMEVKDPEQLESFVEEIKKVYISKNFNDLEYLSSKDTYDLVAGPIESLSTISFTVLIVSIIVSVVILTLVIVMFLKDRRYEIGIYISLGEKKWKILSQIILEVLIVSMLALNLSLLSGMKLGSMITDKIYETSILKDQEVMEDKLAELGSVNPDNLQMYNVTEEMKFELDTEYVFSVYAIGFVVVLLSSTIPVMYILRIEPKKVLM